MAKTIKLETLKATANDCFRNSHNDWIAQRKAIHSFVSDMLLKANAYKGFRYLEASELEPGTSIGIVRATEPGGNHTFPDDSRIAFL